MDMDYVSPGSVEAVFKGDFARGINGFQCDSWTGLPVNLGPLALHGGIL